MGVRHLEQWSWTRSQSYLARQYRAWGYKAVSYKAAAILSLGLCLPLALQTPVRAQSAERQVFDLGTSTTDRASHALGVTIAALVKLKLLPRNNIDINAINTTGSRTNVTSLREGDLDFAILNSLDAHRASEGIGPFAGDGPNPDLRLLTNLWTSNLHFVVRSEFAPTGQFDDFLNLEGRRIALGEEGSSTLDQARALFDAVDVDVDQTYSIQNIGGKEAVEAFLEGELDGFLLVDDGQSGEITSFLERAGDTATSLNFEQNDVDSINARGGDLWTTQLLPAGTLPGQSDAYVVLGMHNLLGANASVSEEAIYQITQTIFDNLPFLEEMHAAATSIDLDTALDKVVLPVHPGAARYYGDVGIAIPEPEPIRTSTLSQTEFLTRFGSVQEARVALSERTFTILSGGVDQTITPMIAELAGMLEEDGIRVVGMTNPKPADNIADVLYARGVDSAVVPLDILDYALEQNVYPGMREKLVYAAELFSEELHLVASSNIDDVEALIGRPVNLGPENDASAFTASFLLDRLNIPVEPTYHDRQTALELLEKGELAAAFFLSGKPMPLLQRIEANQGLRLLELPALEGSAYRPSSLTVDDYPTLLADGDAVQTFAVRTGLVSYSWRSENPRFSVLENFLDVFFEHLPALQDEAGGHHPKWREIDPFSDIEGWRRSPAANRWLQSQDRQAETPNTNTDG